MKKLLVILMVVAMASFLFVGCLPGTTTPVVEEEEEEEVVVVPPTTVAPIIIAVTDGASINAVEAADGIIVNGTAPTYSEVKIYINDICAGTGDTLADGTWTVVVAKADLGADGDKVLYATAKEGALDVSAKSNEKKFTLDTLAPKILAVKARGGTAAVAMGALTYQTFMNLWAGVPPVQVQWALFTNNVLPCWDPTQLLPGVVNWKIEILSIDAIGNIVVRVHNLTAVTAVDYNFVNIPANIVTTSTSWIPGLQISLNDTTNLAAGLSPALHVGAYCLVTTTDTAAIPGRASLTFDEDVSWTQATTGNYTIFNTALGYDILTGNPLAWAPVPLFVRFMAYNEAADNMFWTERVGEEGLHLTQGQWLTFQVDTVADVAGNAIPVTAPETANTVVLAPTIVIAP